MSNLMLQTLHFLWLQHPNRKT